MATSKHLGLRLATIVAGAIAFDRGAKAADVALRDRGCGCRGDSTALSLAAGDVRAR